MRQFIYPVLAVLFLLTSCIKPEEVGQGEELSKEYYDLKGLLNEQQQMLEEQRPNLQKTTLVGDKEEVVNPEEINWQKELKLFQELDINKPVLLRSYSIDTVAQEQGQLLQYEAKNDDLKVRRLEVQLDEEGKAVKVRGAVREENPIYLSERELQIEVEEGKIVRYSLKGFQKVTTQDTTTYQMEATLSW